jgi:muramoyltetrapeptide carboxypeptidase
MAIRPASPADPETVAAGCAILGDLGLAVIGEPVEAPGLPDRPWLAGADAERRAALAEAFAADVAAVWLARGGFGSARLLSSPHPALPHPRAPLVAFSDGTALLAHAWRVGAAAWSGPPLVQLPRLDAASRARLAAFAADLGRAEAPHVPATFGGLRCLSRPHGGGRSGPCGAEPPRTGPLFPANLCVLGSLVGTPLMPDLTGALLALEDTGEAPYRVDRLLTQLVTSGALDGVRGVVFGDLLAGHARPDVVADGLDAVVAAFAREWASPRGIAVAAGLPFGHGPANAPLPCGRASGVTAGLLGGCGPAGPAARPDDTVLAFERAP